MAVKKATPSEWSAIQICKDRYTSTEQKTKEFAEIS